MSAAQPGRMLTTGGKLPNSSVLTKKNSQIRKERAASSFLQQISTQKSTAFDGNNSPAIRRNILTKGPSPSNNEMSMFF